MPEANHRISKLINCFCFCLISGIKNNTRNPCIVACGTRFVMPLSHWNLPVLSVRAARRQGGWQFAAALSKACFSKTRAYCFFTVFAFLRNPAGPVQKYLFYYRKYNFLEGVVAVYYRVLTITGGSRYLFLYKGEKFAFGNQGIFVCIGFAV
jgi:hypothetical protein